MSSVLSAIVPLVPALLAQMPTTTDTDRGMQWFVGAACFAVIFNQVAQAWKTMTGKFNRTQEPDGGYRARKDCIEIHKGLNADRRETFNKLTAADNALRLEMRDDIKGIHARIDDLFEAIGSIMNRGGA